MAGSQPTVDAILLPTAVNSPASRGGVGLRHDDNAGGESLAGLEEHLDDVVQA
jgi:hypothetical protein